jgi:hypothetical protein
LCCNWWTTSSARSLMPEFKPLRYTCVCSWSFFICASSTLLLFQSRVASSEASTHPAASTVTTGRRTWSTWAVPSPLTCQSNIPILTTSTTKHNKVTSDTATETPVSSPAGPLTREPCRTGTASRWAKRVWTVLDRGRGSCTAWVRRRRRGPFATRGVPAASRPWEMWVSREVRSLIASLHFCASFH